ncbi:MAG: POTRA domain-containing protein [Bacteroidia bacterium]
MPKLRLCFLFLSLAFGVLLHATAPDSVQVKAITITGNKVTRATIILRELDFKTGDWLHQEQLSGTLQQNRNQIFNTGLFNQVKLTAVTDSLGTNILIEVTEKWYIWPYPVLTFADRNFNIWWETKDIERLNFGLNVLDYNFRGRAEKLKIRTLWGYTRMVMVDYEIPYLDKEKKKGLDIKLGYLSNKEIWHKAENNRLQFLFDPNQRALRYYFAQLSYLYRPELFTRNQFSVGWSDILVSDTVLYPSQNPEYLAGNRTQQMSLTFAYTFKWDRRDIAYYPLKGHFIETNIEPRYLVQDKSIYLALRLSAEKFYSLGHNFYAGLALRAKASFPEKQPYNLYSSLGYKFFVRGFENYVVDGQHFGLIQTNIKYCLFRKDIDIPLIRMGQFKRAPTSLFLTLYSDGGYVSSTRFAEMGNTYQNTWLQGIGAGLDLVTYYDRVLRLEYSINSFGRKGVYLHFTAPI